MHVHTADYTKANRLSSLSNPADLNMQQAASEGRRHNCSIDTSCAFLFGQHQTFLCADYFHIKSSVQKEKITWNSQNFTALTIREKNIIGQRIAKSLQNRSIAVLTVLGGKHIACRSPPPPRNRKKVYNKNDKRQNSSSVTNHGASKSTGISSLHLLNIISYTIWKTRYQDKACKQNKWV